MDQQTLPQIAGGNVKMVVYIQNIKTLCDPKEYSPTRLLCPWESPGQNPGVGSHSLLQGIFPTQGWFS